MNKKVLVLIALLALIFSSGAYAADGDEFSTTSFRVDDSGEILYKTNTSTVTTNTTVTAAQSGTTFIANVSTANTSSFITFALPTAAAGLTYNFIAQHGSSYHKFILDPASTDTFVGCVNTAVATTFAADDSLISPGATGDSVSLIGKSLYWICTDRTGTFVDYNP